MPDALDNAVRLTWRRLRTCQLLRDCAAAMVVGTLPLIIFAALGHSFSWWWVAWLAGWLALQLWPEKYPMIQPPMAARWLDQRLGLRDLLPSAWHADGIAEPYLRQQANDLLARHSELPTPAWPVRSPAVAAVTVMLLAVTLLLREPSSPTKASVGDPETSAQELTAKPARSRGAEVARENRSEPAEQESSDKANAVALDDPGVSAAAGTDAAETDTLNVTTPRRDSTPATGAGAPGTGSDAEKPGIETSKGDAAADPPALDATSAPNVDANSDAPTVPAHLRDLVDAYFR